MMRAVRRTVLLFLVVYLWSSRLTALDDEHRQLARTDVKKELQRRQRQNANKPTAKTDAVTAFSPPVRPDYAKLEKDSPTQLIHNQEFIQACKDSAGYYHKPVSDPRLSKTILMVGINYGYRDFLHNFKCFMDRQGVKFMAVSLDQDIYRYIKQNKVTPTFLMPELEGRGTINTASATFGGGQFNLIGCRKIEAVAAALALGYDVIFSDVDIVIMRDPLKYLFFNGIDYVHSQNLHCGSKVKWRFEQKERDGNTGFYAVKSNNVTIRTFDLTFRACSKTTQYDDQTMFWLVLRTNTDPSPRPIASCPLPTTIWSGQGLSFPPMDNVITNCPLDECVFSAKNLQDASKMAQLRKQLKMKKMDAVMVHANWISGRQNKIAALEMAGLWIVEVNPNLTAGGGNGGEFSCKKTPVVNTIDRIG